MKRRAERAMFAKIKKGIRAYDVKAKKMTEILNPRKIRLKNGAYAITGTSKLTGNKLFRITGRR